MIGLTHRRTCLLWCAVAALAAGAVAPARAADPAAGRWSKEQAQAWLDRQGWLVGCNFIPSTAINQLEMWQAETFDPATIDRELGYAESLGFNSVRVFLHDLPWKQDAEGFCRRIDEFLALAEKHRIGVMFVLFDSCWHPLPKLGPQPEPLPFTHNSGWVQNPGIEVLRDPARHPHLREYVLGIVGRYRDDPRVQVWDVWNEPDNFDGGNPKRPGLEPKNKPELVLKLLPEVFAWTREARPSQPLTSAIWGAPRPKRPYHATEQFQLAASDVVSYHFYGPLDGMRERVESLREYGRPILCTEFLARPNGSHFDPHLGYMKEQRVAAYCWGFVSGKTQTIYPWDSWRKAYTAEPEPWFHDIFRADGTPYRPAEVEYIRRVTGRE